VNITIHIHDSWAAIPVALSRLLVALAALERPRQPGDDGDDLAELLAGMDDPEPAPAARLAPAPAARLSPASAPAPAPATPSAAQEWDGVPKTGRGLYRWATTHKALPAVNRIGKQFNYPKLVSDWTDDQVTAAYAILTTEPAQNGKAR
jgi:hypothetical protein